MEVLIKWVCSKQAVKRCFFDQSQIRIYDSPWWPVSKTVQLSFQERVARF